MNLSNNEFSRMSYLLGKSQRFILNNDEKDELRNLISKEQPCPLSFDEMVKLGFMIVGMYIINKTWNKTLNI